MSESTTSTGITEAEWQAAREAGLLVATPGTNAQDAAIHKFAQEMYDRGYRSAIEFVATGE